MSPRVRSLSALEILLRQTREDAHLDAYPEVRRNLLTLIRARQRMGLDQDEQTIAVGEVLDRRFLLLLVPSGALKSADTMHLVIRTQEQVHKSRNARRRRARSLPSVWSGGRRIPTVTSLVQGAGDGELEDESDDNGGEAAGGTEA